MNCLNELDSSSRSMKPNCRTTKPTQTSAQSSEFKRQALEEALCINLPNF